MIRALTMKLEIDFRPLLAVILFKLAYDSILLTSTSKDAR